MNLIPINTQSGKMTILYNLLAERTPEQSISHKAMPTKEEHEVFVNSNPYLVWYFIEYNREIMGSVYLTRGREIGIHVFKAHQSMGVGRKAVEMLMEKHPGQFLSNINPGNQTSIDMFTGFGFKLIQQTYEIHS